MSKINQKLKYIYIGLCLRLGEQFYFQLVKCTICVISYPSAMPDTYQAFDVSDELLDIIQ